MKIDVKDLENVLKQIKLANAVNVDIEITNVAGIQRLELEFEDLMQDKQKVTLAGLNSGGFNYITTTKRF